MILSFMVAQGSKFARIIVQELCAVQSAACFKKKLSTVENPVDTGVVHWNCSASPDTSQRTSALLHRLGITMTSKRMELDGSGAAPLRPPATFQMQGMTHLTSHRHAGGPWSGMTHQMPHLPDEGLPQPGMTHQMHHHLDGTQQERDMTRLRTRHHSDGMPVQHTIAGEIHHHLPDATPPLQPGMTHQMHRLPADNPSDPDMTHQTHHHLADRQALPCLQGIHPRTHPRPAGSRSPPPDMTHLQTHRHLDASLLQPQPDMTHLTPPLPADSEPTTLDTTHQTHPPPADSRPTPDMTPRMLHHPDAERLPVEGMTHLMSHRLDGTPLQRVQGLQA